MNLRPIRTRLNASIQANLYKAVNGINCVELAEQDEMISLRKQTNKRRWLCWRKSNATVLKLLSLTFFHRLICHNPITARLSHDRSRVYRLWSWALGWQRSACKYRVNFFHVYYWPISEHVTELADIMFCQQNTTSSRSQGPS